MRWGSIALVLAAAGVLVAPFPGAIDDVRIYDHALTPTELGMVMAGL